MFKEVANDTQPYHPAVEIKVGKRARIPGQSEGHPRISALLSSSDLCLHVDGSTLSLSGKAERGGTLDQISWGIGGPRHKSLTIHCEARRSCFDRGRR